MQLFDRTLGQWLEHWAEETPDKEYIVYSDRNLRFTWSQLNRRVDDMAKGLIAIGVERGTHVGIWAANVPDWLTLLYACEIFSIVIGAVLSFAFQIIDNACYCHIIFLLPLLLFLRWSIYCLWIKESSPAVCLPPAVDLTASEPY